MTNCDSETGVCNLPESSEGAASQALVKASVPTVRYIGDPMCSWCWGISPVLKEVESYCRSRNVDFSVYVGGLRPGGGDEWALPFKNFLRHEWENIHRVTGQPFGFSLLDKAEFNYDTEPACRAVVVMSELLKRRQRDSQALLTFFSGIQKRFYVDGADPREPPFYRDLCVETEIPYEEFFEAFHSAGAKAATVQEFQRCRSWGIRGFPSLVLDLDGRMTPLVSGYTTSTALIQKLESLLGDSPKSHEGEQ